MTIVNYVVWNFLTKQIEEVKQLELDDRNFTGFKCEPPLHEFPPGSSCCACTLIPVSRVR